MGRLRDLVVVGSRSSRGLAFASAALLVAGVVGLVALVVRDRLAVPPAVTLDLAGGARVVVSYDPNDPHAFTASERAAIDDVVTRAVPDVRRALPDLPASLVLRILSAPPDRVIPETGENGSNALPNVVTWEIDTGRAEGAVAIVRRELRGTLFHELHHLVRAELVTDRTLRDDVVREGLATAFERDFAPATPAWGVDPPEIDAWTREVLALAADAPRDAWLHRTPDGRRWVGMRVGVYLVDRAMRASGKTSAELVRTPTSDVLALAGVGPDAGAPARQ